MYVSGGWPFRMTGSVREALPDVQEWLGSPPGSPEALTGFWLWSVGSPECPGVINMPSQMSCSCREALPDVREWSECPPGCTGVVERPFRMAGSGQRPSQMSGSD